MPSIGLAVARQWVLVKRLRYRYKLNVCDLPSLFLVGHLRGPVVNMFMCQPNYKGPQSPGHPGLHLTTPDPPAESSHHPANQALDTRIMQQTFLRRSRTLATKASRANALSLSTRMNITATGRTSTDPLRKGIVSPQKVCPSWSAHHKRSLYK